MLQEYTYNRVLYTVDYRLSQFRACKGGWASYGKISFVDFDSELGDRILCKMIRDGVLDYSQANL